MKLSLIVAPEDTIQAQTLGYPLIQLAYGLGDEKQFYLTVRHPLPRCKSRLMGLCDDVLPEGGKPDVLATQILRECERQGYQGVFAHFQRPVSKLLLSLLEILEASLYSHSLILMVPECYGKGLTKAQILISSPGWNEPFPEHLRSGLETYGSRGIPLFRQLQTFFPLPYSPGKEYPITQKELDALLETAPACYSEALGCNYLMTHTQAGPGLVLFDTPGTLTRKQTLAEGLGYNRAVAFYPEGSEFISLSS